MKGFAVILLGALITIAFFLVPQARAQVDSPSVYLPVTSSTPSDTDLEQPEAVANVPAVFEPTVEPTLAAPAATPTPLPISPTTEPTVAQQAPAAKTALPSPTSVQKPPTARPSPTPAQLTVQGFSASLANGRGNELVGAFADGLFALRVKQQPANNPAYIYAQAGYATLFSVPLTYGTTALLAHNYLSGAQFSALKPGQRVYLIYGDGSVRSYRISTLLHFRALNPEDPYSSFIDLDNGQRTLSSDQLFRQVYMNSGSVVFQTCIAANGNSSWGRLFVVGVPD